VETAGAITAATYGGVTGANLVSLTDNSIADSLHRHSELVASDGSPDPAVSVDADGNVGIGSSSPVKNLDIFAEVPIQRLTSTRNTSSWTNGDIIAGIEFYTTDGSSYGTGVVGAIRSVHERVDHGPQLAPWPDLVFYSGRPESGFQERMRLHNGGNISVTTGNLLIGTTDASELVNIGSTAWADVQLRSTNASAGVGGRIFFDNTNSADPPSHIQGAPSAIDLIVDSAIQFSVKDGVINIPNIPTSSFGLSSGDLYKSGSYLRIV